MTPHTVAAAPAFPPGLLDRLPKARGRLSANAALGHMTWLGVGGPAEVLFKPADREDLATFISACPADVPVMTLGVASNMIIRDGGIPGVVIRLGREFSAIEMAEEPFSIVAGAAAMDINVALFAQSHAVGGLEFLSGIPGTVGGGLRMNAGAYGGEFKDIVIKADVLLRAGTLKTLTPAEMGMTYRHSGVPEDAIFLGALFKGVPGQPDEIAQKMDDIKVKRSESQPIKSKTGGSTFANPEGHRAWQLIDAAGCRGLKIGPAEVSALHCNFLINTGGASAAEIERLGETVRQRVYESAGVMLRWEVKRVGIPLEKDRDILDYMKRDAS